MLSAIKSKAAKLKSLVANRYNIIYRWLRRNRKKIIITLCVLASIALIVALVMFAYHGIGITSQANVINYT